MHTTTSFPFLPAAERPHRVGIGSLWPAFRSAFFAGLARLFGRPVFVGRQAFPPRRLMAFLETRVRAAAQRRLPILVGDAARPFDATLPDASRGLRALLETLKRHAGLELVVTSRSPQLLRELDSLIELDQSHAVAIDVPLPCVDPLTGTALDLRAAEPQQCLWMVRKLAEQGLTTRIVLPAACDLRDEELLRPLVAAAHAYGAFDVVPAASRVNSRLLRQLRLEHDLPRPLPGRG